MPYFDHAATTPVDPRALAEFARLAPEALNASSIHAAGQRARRLLDGCRERLAAAMRLPDAADIVFTSGATEAANFALRGLAARGPRPLRVATSAIEHSCVRDTLGVLAAQGAVDLVELPVGEDGRARLEPARLAAVHLLCLMHGNNETGVIQDVAAARERRAGGRFLWLCDASQSLGKVPLDLGALEADLVILSSHKIYGPAGVGCLAGPGLGQLVPQITGGPQEDERRAGTQPVALVAAFVRAAELAVEELDARRAHLLALEEHFLAALRELGVAFQLNGAAERLPGFLNLSFAGFEAVDVVIALDQAGHCVSPGSACSTGVVAVSPVLSAMFGNETARAAGGVRITFGKDTTEPEVTALAGDLAAVVAARA